MMETLNAITLEQMAYMTVQDKGKKPLMSITDMILPPISLLSHLKSVPRHKLPPELNGKGWHIMFNMGFTPGEGLGKYGQGHTSTPCIKAAKGKMGLGNSEDRAQPVGALSWILHEHFTRGPIQPGTLEESTSTQPAEKEQDKEPEEGQVDFGLLSLFVHDTIIPSKGTFLLCNHPAPAFFIPFHFHPTIPPLISYPSSTHSICTFSHSQKKKSPTAVNGDVKFPLKNLARLSHLLLVKGQLSA